MFCITWNILVNIIENLSYTILSLIFIFFIKRLYFTIINKFNNNHDNIVLLDIRKLNSKINNRNETEKWNHVRCYFNDNGMTVYLDYMLNEYHKEVENLNVRNVFISNSEIPIILRFKVIWYIFLFYIYKKCLCKINGQNTETINNIKLPVSGTFYELIISKLNQK